MLQAIILIVVVKTTTVISYSVPFFLKPELCETEDCEILGGHVSQSLDTSFDPCEDFYRYSCQGWVSKTRKPDFALYWNHWQQIELNTNKKIQYLLNSEETSNFSFNLSKQLYKACLRNYEKEKENTDELKVFINSIGGWPITEKNWNKRKSNWFHKIIKVSRFLNVFPVLKFKIEVDFLNSSNTIIYLSHGETILPSIILLDPKQHLKQIKVYKTWIYQTIKHLYKHELSKDMWEQVTEIFNFEMKLAKLINSIDDRPKRINIINFMEKTKLDIIGGLQFLFHEASSIIKPTTKMVVTCENYLKKLLMLLQVTKRHIVENYITWYSIKDLSREASPHLRRLSFEMDKVIFGITSDTNLEYDCSKFVADNMAFALVKPYFDTYIHPDTFREVDNMIQNIRKEFINTLQNNGWLTEATKSAVIEKIIELKYYIGYPKWAENTTLLDNYYKELNVSDNHFLNVFIIKRFNLIKQLERVSISNDKIGWWLNSFESNAGYSILKNSIIIPLGMLDKPFFDINRPLVFNYGSLGSIIGHELSHALDDRGRRADQSGQIRNWWQNEDVLNYNRNIECFLKQYNEFGTDGIETIGENIADNVGVQISLKAFQNLENLHSRKVIPSLEFYSDTQLFFLSFAQTWCELPSTNKFTQVLRYAPERIRVLATVSNSIEFSKSFLCSTVNSTKCTLW